MIFLVTPPPVDQFKTKKHDQENGHADTIRTSAVTAAYAEKTREVARAGRGVILIDLWQAVMDEAVSLTPKEYEVGGPWLGSPENGKSGGLDTLLPDGLHMSGDAYRVFLDILTPHIREFADDEVDRKEYIFPDWLELCPPNLAPKFI